MKSPCLTTTTLRRLSIDHELNAHSATAIQRGGFNHQGPDSQGPHGLFKCAAGMGMAIALLALTSCATRVNLDLPSGPEVQIVRTTHGIPHISAPDARSLAYGVAYAHAQDNVCQTANQLVTVRGQRAATFGGGQNGSLLGRRWLPNEQIDLFIAAHMDDASLARQHARTSPEAQQLALGYVEGYNRFLADTRGKLPAACNNATWVSPMTLADYRRLVELTSVQAGIAALADAMLGAMPPMKPKSALAPTLSTPDPLAAAAVMRELGLLDSPLGSNAWAFGKDTTANGSGLLLGNPHFPWTGVNRFWQMHLTIPGSLDVMGASIGHGAVVQIGFNRDVAWSHTVSTGKRFTLHELTLDAQDPTKYYVDGKLEKLELRVMSIQTRDEKGQMQSKSGSVWQSRWGPVVVIPRAGLTWNNKTAYAFKDANAGNARSVDTWLGFGRAQSVADMQKAMANLGVPWVNTIAADRHGQAMYADVSVVPDVDAAQLERCAPSKPAAALLKAAGLVVLDGSKSSCDWRQDPASPVPGLTPMARMPVAVRTDWVHNSNDSFYYTHPAQSFANISPLVGDSSLTRPRTRAGLLEIPQMLAAGKATPSGVQAQLFTNRNFMAHVVLPDLLAACAKPPSAAAQQGCTALAGWDKHNNLDSKGAHLFREFWRTARAIAGVHAQAFDPAQPVSTPSGLKMNDPAIAPKVWAALETAVNNVKSAGFALDAPLSSVQRPAITDLPIGLHGGDEIEGVLNNLGRQEAAGINKDGLRIDYGTSYVQTVTFDKNGPLAQALLTYGQSTNPGSPHATDQLQLFANQQWPHLPFHADDVKKAMIGSPLILQTTNSSKP